jgi:hypothetical protein
MDKRMGSRFGRLAVPALVLVLGGVAAACGSGSSSTAAKAPAGAKENATYIGSAVCKDVKSGAVVGCALDTIGPGGGYVFYDHGSQQSWGRFLEVAPWTWNPDNGDRDCAGGCGADTTSVLKPVLDKTQDGPASFKLICSAPDDLTTAANTDEALGTGAANTAKLVADPACKSGISGSAVDRVTAYRGGGLSDWFLPSKEELYLLCSSPGRNYVGGFNANGWYVSSSTDSNDSVWAVRLGGCARDTFLYDSNGTKYFSVRPIRAFS